MLWLIASKYDGWAFIGAWAAIRMNIVLSKQQTQQTSVESAECRVAVNDKVREAYM